MPLLIFQNLRLSSGLKLTNITLQFAKRFLTYPRGIVEDILVKVGKFILIVGFVVLDMEKDEKVPSILGRPFLATGDAVIDV